VRLAAVLVAVEGRRVSGGRVVRLRRSVDGLGGRRLRALSLDRLALGRERGGR